MELSCPLGTTRRVPREKFPQKPYNKSFIDQACSVKMAGYWPRSFFCEFVDLDSVSVHKQPKKELGQFPAILTSHLVNNPYLSQFCSSTLVIVEEASSFPTNVFSMVCIKYSLKNQIENYLEFCDMNVVFLSLQVDVQIFSTFCVLTVPI